MEQPRPPTLGELKARLLDGIPPAGVELSFDLGYRSSGGDLNDALVVTNALCRRALDGEFDALPLDTPIEELW
jgi:hypothetical protein